MSNQQGPFVGATKLLKMVVLYVAGKALILVMMRTS